MPGTAWTRWRQVAAWLRTLDEQLGEQLAHSLSRLATLPLVPVRAAVRQAAAAALSAEAHPALFLSPTLLRDAHRFLALRPEPADVHLLTRLSEALSRAKEKRALPSPPPIAAVPTRPRTPRKATALPTH